MALVVVGAFVGAAPPAAGAEQRGGGTAGHPPREPVDLLAVSSTASDINDHGVVVGSYVPEGADEIHAFRRSARGRVTDLGPGTVQAVNNRSAAVGERRDENGVRHATRWDADGRAHDLGVGPDSGASDISDRGVVVGFVGSPLGPHAFVAAPGAAPVVLPQAVGMPLNAQLATAVNERGDIAGASITPATFGFTALVWRGRAHTPTVLPGTNAYTEVNGMNESGTVVGTTLTGDGFQAVIWTGRDHLQVAIGGPRSEGRAVNDRGQVAGMFSDTQEVFLWDPRTNRATALAGLSPYCRASAVNNAGAVVGSCTTPDGDRATLFGVPRPGALPGTPPTPP